MFIIRKGKTLEETPEFISYQRTFNNLWPKIYNIIKSLEKLLTEYDVKLANIDGLLLLLLIFYQIILKLLYLLGKKVA